MMRTLKVMKKIGKLLLLEQVLVVQVGNARRTNRCSFLGHHWWYGWICISGFLGQKAGSSSDLLLRSGSKN